MIATARKKAANWRLMTDSWNSLSMTMNEMSAQADGWLDGRMGGYVDEKFMEIVQKCL